MYMVADRQNRQAIILFGLVTSAKLAKNGKARLGKVPFGHFFNSELAEFRSGKGAACPV